jgi:hypothetical protein
MQAPNKHIMFIRCAHWDAYSLARLILREYSQQACAPYVKRYEYAAFGLFVFCKIGQLYQVKFVFVSYEFR